jgi:hypothetical protein
MSWSKLQANKVVTKLPPSKAELDNLRRISCRTKRNLSEYTDAGIITDTEAEELLKTVLQFQSDAETWIKANHPSLA